MLKENPDMLDGEMFEILGWSNESCHMTIFNQDEERLNFVSETNSETRFAVKGKTLSSLHLFVFDSFEDWLRMEKEGIKKHPPIDEHYQSENQPREGNQTSEICLLNLYINSFQSP